MLVHVYICKNNGSLLFPLEWSNIAVFLVLSYNHWTTTMLNWCWIYQAIVFIQRSSTGSDPNYVSSDHVLQLTQVVTIFIQITVTVYAVIQQSSSLPRLNHFTVWAQIKPLYCPSWSSLSYGSELVLSVRSTMYQYCHDFSQQETIHTRN